MLSREFIFHLKENNQNPVVKPVSNPSASTPSDIVLVIPPSPAPCEQDDYPDIHFWNRREWTAYIQNQQVKGNSIKKLRFITQGDGTMVSNERIVAMSKEARELWGVLYYKRLGPANWGSKMKTASEFFSNSMRLKFEEF
jgi:hypothetical protein